MKSAVASWIRRIHWPTCTSVESAYTQAGQAWVSLSPRREAAEHLAPLLIEAECPGNAVDAWPAPGAAAGRETEGVQGAACLCTTPSISTAPSVLPPGRVVSSLIAAAYQASTNSDSDFAPGATLSEHPAKHEHTGRSVFTKRSGWFKIRTMTTRLLIRNAALRAGLNAALRAGLAGACEAALASPAPAAGRRLGAGLACSRGGVPGHAVTDPSARLEPATRAGADRRPGPQRGTVQSRTRQPAPDGPEFITFDAQGRLYTGDESGTIYRVTPGGPSERFADTRGRPNGLPFAPDGNLLVADTAGACSA